MKSAKVNRRRVQANPPQIRRSAPHKIRKQDVHKWKVLYAQAEVDHRIMLNMNLQTPENRTTIGPQHIIAAEKAA